MQTIQAISILVAHRTDDFTPKAVDPSAVAAAAAAAAAAARAKAATGTRPRIALRRPGAFDEAGGAPEGMIAQGVGQGGDGVDDTMDATLGVVEEMQGAATVGKGVKGAAAGLGSAYVGAYGRYVEADEGREKDGENDQQEEEEGLAGAAIDRAGGAGPGPSSEATASAAAGPPTCTHGKNGAPKKGRCDDCQRFMAPRTAGLGEVSIMTAVQVYT